MLLRILFIIFLVIVMIISAVNLDYRIVRSYLGLSKTNTSLGYITNNYNTTVNMTQNRSSQYIWCVNHYGPNNQLKDFVKCCVIAMMHNYTLIIPPLFPHYADKIQDTQWFDHIYNLKKLNFALNFVTLDQFISERINKKKIMIDCYIQQIESIIYETSDARKILGFIEDAFKINVTFYRHINVSRDVSVNDVFNKAKNCSSILLHIEHVTFFQFFYSPNSYTQFIFKHLHRTPLIKRMASALIKLLPELVINRNHSKTQLHTLAVIHMRLGDMIIMPVSRYIEEILYLIKTGVQFTHLHIMCPYLNGSDIKQLTESLPIPFTATQHLLPHVRFLLDEYIFDVLEQEIAYQASIFLASTYSTYSATVLMQKVCQKHGTVYVLPLNKKVRPHAVMEKNVTYFH